MIDVTKLPEKIAELLADVSPLYIGEIPSLADEGIGMTLRAGADDLRYFGQERSMERPMIIFNIRTATYQNGMNIAEIIMDTLDGFYDEDIASCLKSGTVTYLGRNQQKMHEMTISFVITLK